MIEKVKGLSICGRCFSKKTNLAFFPNDNDRIAIVYGKNGSGKSTISDGFSQIASGEDAEELSASLIDRADNEIGLVPESKIFVFNEKYIDENVKIDVNCTPFVRQYGILFRKWGVFVCQKEYQTNDIRRNSREWL